MSDSYIYIDGENGIEDIFMMPFPSGRHESLISEYLNQFRDYFNVGSSCRIFGSNTGLFIGHRWDQIKHLKTVQKAFKNKIQEGKERDISIAPDLMVICGAKVEDFDYRGYHGIPKIVIEVWSPTTGTDDTTWKKDIYEALGILEYWVILDEDNAHIFRLDFDGVYELEKYPLERGKDVLEIPCNIFDGLVVKIDKRMILGNY